MEKIKQVWALAKAHPMKYLVGLLILVIIAIAI